MKLKDRLRIKEKDLVLHTFDESGREPDTSISGNVLKRIRDIACGSLITAEHTIRDYKLYFGPLIDETDTGYVIQSLNTGTRRFATVRIIFNGNANMDTVRKFMRQFK